jgi:hypothetical protein
MNTTFSTILKHEIAANAIGFAPARPRTYAGSGTDLPTPSSAPRISSV